MEIGLLLCDDVPDDLTHISGHYLDMFKTLLPSTRIVPYSIYLNQLPKSAQTHSHWLISGSRFSVYQDLPWIHQLHDLVRDMQGENTRCLGVCFGHQLIASALGGQVQKAQTGWEIGVKTFTCRPSPFWKDNARAQFNILMMCQDQVTKLPPDAELLATSETCPIGMYKIGDQFLAIQGHPEYTKEYDKALILKRKERYRAPLFSHGLNSLSKTVDRKFLQELIIAFFQGLPII